VCVGVPIRTPGETAYDSSTQPTDIYCRGSRARCLRPSNRPGYPIDTNQIKGEVQFHTCCDPNLFEKSRTRLPNCSITQSVVSVSMLRPRSLVRCETRKDMLNVHSSIDSDQIRISTTFPLVTANSPSSVALSGRTVELTRRRDFIQASPDQS
jgi:hypothetical protein